MNGMISSQFKEIAHFSIFRKIFVFSDKILSEVAKWRMEKEDANAFWG